MIYMNAVQFTILFMYIYKQAVCIHVKLYFVFTINFTVKGTL